mgnify:CR=1 FL=1
MILTIGAVREEDIIFSATGHDHSGGVNGENVPEAAVVFSAAGPTHVGGAQGNTLGLDALQVNEQSAENAAAVTLPSESIGFVGIATLAEMTVAAGDRVILAAIVPLTKGATAGIEKIQAVKQIGTATIQAYNDTSEIQASRQLLANEVRNILLSGVVKVTVSGTLTIRVQGISDGSDSTIAIGAGQLYVLVLRGVG